MGGSNSTHAHSNYLICMRFIPISTVVSNYYCCDVSAVCIYMYKYNIPYCLLFFRRAVLQKWREKHGPAATYRNLAVCFYKADNLQMVERVCQALGASSASAVKQHVQQGVYAIYYFPNYKCTIVLMPSFLPQC